VCRTMTTPDGQKSSKFTPEAHTRLMALARDLDGTADDALRHLLGMSTIRVEVTDLQRDRWTRAADELGVSVDEFVRLRVEASIRFDLDRETLNQIFYRVDGLFKAVGVPPEQVNPRLLATPKPPEGDPSP
jgi:hypothetical protein